MGDGRGRLRLVAADPARRRHRDPRPVAADAVDHAPPGAGSGAAPAGRALRAAGVPLTVSLLLALGIAIYAMATPANDLAGTLPTEAAAEVPPDQSGRASGRERVCPDA